MESWSGILYPLHFVIPYNLAGLPRDNSCFVLVNLLQYVRMLSIRSQQQAGSDGRVDHFLASDWSEIENPVFLLVES